MFVFLSLSLDYIQNRDKNLRPAGFSPKIFQKFLVAVLVFVFRLVKCLLDGGVGKISHYPSIDHCIVKSVTRTLFKLFKGKVVNLDHSL